MKDINVRDWGTCHVLITMQACVTTRHASAGLCVGYAKTWWCKSLTWKWMDGTEDESIGIHGEKPG